MVHIDEKNDRRLRFYAFADRAWDLALDRVLAPEVWFVGVANVGGRDRLITSSPRA